MKRMHVNLVVADLPHSVQFYTDLFGADPTVIKADYAKWMLDDPRVNFAIAARGRTVGLDHLGIQVEDSDELAEVYERLKLAEGPVIEQGQVGCCYAQSEKSWIIDPQGVRWETFLTNGETTDYGEETIEALDALDKAACCTPEPAAAPCCTKPSPSEEVPCCGPVAA